MSHKFILAALAAFLTFIQAQPSVAQQKASCPRMEAIQQIQQAAQTAGATIEPVHLKDGITIVVMSPNATAAAPLHAAAENYVRVRTDTAKTKSARNCERVWRAVANGQLTEAVEKTLAGFLIVYKTDDPKIVAFLHKDGCCQFCVCPSTSWRCSGCC